MEQGYRMFGFVVIVILYATIGFLAAAGAIFIARKILAPKAEQIFFAMFLIMIAAFYLALPAYFGLATACRLALQPSSRACMFFGIMDLQILAVRVGFGPRPRLAAAQLIDLIKSQKRQNRCFRRSEVHGGYTGYRFHPSLPRLQGTFRSAP